LNALLSLLIVYMKRLKRSSSVICRIFGAPLPVGARGAAEKGTPATIIFPTVVVKGAEAYTTYKVIGRFLLRGEWKG